MTIIAKLKALLHLDNAQYKEGMKDAAGQTVTFKRELRATNTELRGVKTTAAGLAAIMRGDLLNGVTLLTRGLTGMGSAAAKAVGQLGLIVGTAAAAYQAGKWLNEKTGWGTKLADKVFGTKEGNSYDADQAGQKARHAANVSAEQEATRIQAENKAARLDALEGEVKLQAKFAQESSDIVIAMQNTTNAKLKKAYADKLTILLEAHVKELQAIRAKEDAKREAEIAKERQGNVQRSEAYEQGLRANEATADEKRTAINERFEERKASIQGRGIRADSMAQVGGFVGQGRPGMAMADRQMKIQQEIIETNKQLAKVNADLKRSNEELAEKYASGSTTMQTY